ncbi:MAG: AMP-binding protein, partial [Micromonosporaceae bacterium]
MGPEWVDDVLLAGPDADVCLDLGAPITRAELRGLVSQCQVELEASGVARGGAVALRLPPSLVFVTNLLASWRIGAQTTLLDYRLTQYEIDRALERVGAQVVVEAKSMPA